MEHERKTSSDSILSGGSIKNHKESGLQPAESMDSILDALLVKRAQLLKNIEEIDEETKETQQQLRSRLEELLNCRRLFDEALLHVEALLKIEGWGSGGDAGKSAVPWMAGSHRKRPAEAAHELLTGIGEPIHYRDLATRLKAYGVPVAGQDPAANLLSSMSRDSRFQRYGRGVYGLTSWNTKTGSDKGTHPQSRKRR